jgi:3-oxoacyl-[acyl-carrier protein] reductase
MAARFSGFDVDLKLRGSVVMIVGATAGIGAATARLLVAEGARLALVARREAELNRVCRELVAAGGDVLALPGDASVGGALDAAVAKAVTHFGMLHGVVVVAGPVGARAQLHELSDQQWESYFRQGLMISVAACRAAVPELLKTAHSAIVLTSAYSVRAQKPDLVAYTAFKTAIVAVSKNMAKTYGGRGLRVNCIAPGVIEKDAQNTRELARRYGVTEARARYEHVHRKYGMHVALERAGRHEEFAAPIAFLLSGAASYVTGALLNIDGGTDF